MNWLTEEEYLSIVVDGKREKLEEVLDRVYNKAIEQALCHIPDIVNKLSRKVSEINKYMTKLLADYPTFAKHRDVVIAVVQQIEIENPQLMFDEILERAIPIVQRRIANIEGGLVRIHKHIQGRDLEEQMASVDGLLNSILAKPRKEVTTVHFAAPSSFHVEQTEKGSGFFTVGGTLSRIGALIASCDKDTELVIQLFYDDTVMTKRFKVKSGLNQFKDTIQVPSYTRITVGFSLPVLDAHVGYVFIPERGQDETAPLAD